MTATFDNIVGDTLTLRNEAGNRLGGMQWSAAELAVAASVVHPIDLRTVRVWDSAALALLPQTSVSDDLGLYVGTFATSSWIIKTFDVKTLTTTLYGRFSAFVPPRFVTGQGFGVRFWAGMLGAVADTSFTIDLQAYKISGETGIGSDLVTTSATAMNSLVFANKDFVITSSGLAVGDELDCRVALSVVDAAGASAVAGAIGKIGVICTLQG